MPQNASAPLVFPVLPGALTPLTLWDSCENGFATAGNVIATAHNGNNRLSTQAQSTKLVSTTAANVFAGKARAIAGMDQFDSGIVVYFQGHDYDSAFIQDTRFDFGTADSAAAATSTPQIPRSGWNFVPFQRLEFQTVLVGAQIPYFATKAFTSFELRSSGNAVPLELYVGGVYFGGRRKGRIIWHIDDPWTTGYDSFVNKCDPYGWKLTIFACRDLVNTAQHMSVADLLGAKARGYVIGNHSATHANMGAVDGATLMSTELNVNAAWLVANGLNTVSGGFDSSLCYAAPFGVLKQTHIDSMRAAGYWFARTTNDDHQTIEADAVNPWGCGSLSIGAATTAAQIRQAIRLAAARGSVLRLLVHGVKAGATGSDCTPEIFNIAVEETRMLELQGLIDVKDELSHRIECGSIPVWW